MSTAVTPHACSTIEQSRCDGDGCGGTYSADRYAGVCDPDGCDFNAYRMGVKDFYGKGMTVDTSKKFTVVTQFKGTGDAMEIKRFYVQGGKTIEQPASAIPSLPHSVMRRSRSLVTDTRTRRRVEPPTWPRLLPRVWYLSCRSGTTITPTCCGLTQPTPRTRTLTPTWVVLVALATSLPVPLLMLRARALMLQSSTPTSSLVLSTPPSSHRTFGQ
jgi:hypothetical protein